MGPSSWLVKEVGGGTLALLSNLDQHPGAAFFGAIWLLALRPHPWGQIREAVAGAQALMGAPLPFPLFSSPSGRWPFSRGPGVSGQAAALTHLT